MSVFKHQTCISYSGECNQRRNTSAEDGVQDRVLAA
jgi:hypothetical protein